MNITSSKRRGPVKLSPKDLLPYLVEKEFSPAPDVVEYRMPETQEVLPFIRCIECNKSIFSQSQIIREKIDREQERIRAKSKRELGVERGMSVDEYNAVIGGFIEESGLQRACCRIYSVEQFIMPREVHVENVRPNTGRPIPGPGKMVGNVKIRNVQRVPYNPYTANAKSLVFEDDPDEPQLDSKAIVRDTQPSLRDRMRGESLEVFDEELYPSMPPIDTEFREEEKPTYQPSGNEEIAGLVYTGVPGLESILVRGRSIPAR
ncbi:Hypothetical protein POVR2_LOCUS313 [uncultured virus]|nr:Hypothetical protein POVR2_LOCUS313 [uncultured virus]